MTLSPWGSHVTQSGNLLLAPHSSHAAPHRTSTRWLEEKDSFKEKHRLKIYFYDHPILFGAVIYLFIYFSRAAYSFWLQARLSLSSATNKINFQMSPWPFVFAVVVPRPTQFFSFFLAAIALSPFSFFCVWECVQNKAKLIMKSQASAGWLACERAPATSSLMPERGGAQPRSLADCPPCAHIAPLHFGSLAKVAKPYGIDIAWSLPLRMWCLYF